MSIPYMLLTLLTVFAVEWRLPATYSPANKVLKGQDSNDNPYFDNDKPQFYSEDDIMDAKSRTDLRFTSNELNYLMVANELRMAIISNSLEGFYPNADLVDQLAIHICDRLAREGQNFKRIGDIIGAPLLEAYKLTRLALYDVHMVADDSGSIFSFDQRERELKEYSTMLINIVSLFDSNGLDFYFLNHICDENGGKYKFRNSDEFMEVFGQINRNGCTPTGSTLSDRVIKPLFGNIDEFNKPVLVYLLTDGVPYHGLLDPDSLDTPAAKLLVENAFLDAHALKLKYKMPATAIEFGIGQIGTAAKEWLDKFDVHPIIGENVDVTGDFDAEKVQIPGLEEWQWKLKFILGAIDNELDSLDFGKNKLHSALQFFDLDEDALSVLNPLAKAMRYKTKMEELEQQGRNTFNGIKKKLSNSGSSSSSSSSSSSDSDNNGAKRRMTKAFSVDKYKQELENMADDAKLDFARYREFIILKKYADAYLLKRTAQLQKNQILPSLDYSNIQYLFKALASEYNYRQKFFSGEKSNLDDYVPLKHFYGIMSRKTPRFGRHRTIKPAKAAAQEAAEAYLPRK
eukprot:NODE_666_length_4904_cov_0.563580.p1 type:complete len:571 gc:universal NODE_666_length_4904_cov_0.563580:2888-4600(+)